ncbi:MAG: bifunctional phosphopantothenoylcysteine decarboxylase/phosphopantothenate--cysteine ligase CoaBC [Microscillaceae bacterium]|jgi:phosphopantothenoylcysteine decarboxylase/phosphopantothenate--cysteine ligase|nr:bifunctional phosphopantothenoylcysteine decarboxylase/phosphopantothenate--cysteine ligase CoaBC [Microscillaceae bacterium]
MLKGKKIIIGVTGSIAAYKSALLVRLLVKAEAEVKVVMTASASEFISPLTLATLSKNPVLIDFVQDKTGVWHNHVELGLWADALVIAPASANTLAKCANGLCDNLLTAVYLSARCPVLFAPAMDLDMYKHPATQANLQKIQSFGQQIIPSEYGELASGLVGEGRMAEPEHILQLLADFLTSPPRATFDLTGKKVLITAGPTQEAIDPVRFISNHSSGKMGYALAEAAAEAGAEVYLVSGPTHLSVQHPNIHRLSVSSAQTMYEAAQKYFAQAQIIILAAAVADFTPKSIANQKIKKKEGENTMVIELTKTIDIAHTLGQIKTQNQIFVGFALETENELENALGKLHRKNFDWIVLNSLNKPGAGFGHDTNQITLINREGEMLEFPLQSKQALAYEIWKNIMAC